MASVSLEIHSWTPVYTELCRETNPWCSVPFPLQSLALVPSGMLSEPWRDSSHLFTALEWPSEAKKMHFQFPFCFQFQYQFPGASLGLRMPYLAKKMPLLFSFRKPEVAFFFTSLGYSEAQIASTQMCTDSLCFRMPPREDRSSQIRGRIFHLHLYSFLSV